MKIKNIVYFFLLAAFSLTQFSCGYSTEPENDSQLIITDGHFTKIQNPESGGYIYTAEVTYKIEGKQCLLAGYGVKWDSNTLDITDFYEQQVILPGRIYKIKETLYLDTEINRNPKITLKVSNFSEHTMYESYLLQQL